MHEIASKAEFAMETLYKFFKNKEDLYRQPILDLSQRFHLALTKAIEGYDDEVEKLRNYVRAKGEVFRANAQTIRLYLSETQGVKFHVMADPESEIRNQYFAFLESLSLVFEKGIDKGRFNRIAGPYQLALALDSVVHAFLFLWLEDPKGHPYPEDPNKILQILFKSLIG